MGEPAERVPFVGLTGGLGAGKSTALEALAELGAATLSTDAVVHELLGTQEVVDAVVARLGPEVMRDGRVDRAAVASTVFDSPADRDWLEGLLWPLVGKRVMDWRREIEEARPGPSAAVVEVPLLFESGMEVAFDHTIAVVAGEALRAARADARGHAAVGERAGRQLTQEEKSQRADFTVRNDGTREELRAELSRVLDSIDH
jgi:dephospho-CoA kinase